MNILSPLELLKKIIDKSDDWLLDHRKIKLYAIILNIRLEIFIIINYLKFMIVYFPNYRLSYRKYFWAGLEKMCNELLEKLK